MSRLFVFTISFPYGLFQQWKAGEFVALKRYFKEVVIIPHEYQFKGEAVMNEFMGIQVETPLFKQQVYLKPWKLAHLFSPRFLAYLREFISQKVFLSKEKLMSFFTATYKIEKMLKTQTIKELMGQKDKSNTVLYFYWGAGSSVLVPFLKGFKNAIVRFHGYDLYEDRNNGYMPFRGLLAKKISYAVFISNHGMNYMRNKYPVIDGKCGVFRIGTIARGDSLPGSDNRLHIVSCSSVKELKRVSLILRAIKKIGIPVTWMHIGDGEFFDELQREAANVPANVEVRLMGHIASDKVQDYYVGRMIDVFVNVSTTEGVPVSVMEAMSASIPVIATDVGGTGEIVDNTVGMLIPAEISEDELLAYLLSFYNMEASQKLELRKNAKKRYEEFCNASDINEKFARFMSNKDHIEKRIVNNGP